MDQPDKNQPVIPVDPDRGLNGFKKYFNNLVSKSFFKVLPINRKGDMINPATEDTQKKIEDALRTMFTGVEMIKGKDAKPPTTDQLLGLIKPLIPPAIPGKPGPKPTKEELRELIKPLIPDVKDGETPKAGSDYPSNDQIVAFIEKKIEEIELPTAKPGEMGPMPQHEWDKNKRKIRFEVAPGEWGDWITVIDIDAEMGDRGGRANFFWKLLDVPHSYKNQALKVVRVNAREDGLEFATSTGGGTLRSVNTAVGTTTAGATASTDYVYFCNGTFTITLPTAVGNTNRYTIKNIGAGTVTIATTGGQTIDGGSTAAIPTQYPSVDLQSDGSNWFII